MTSQPDQSNSPGRRDVDYGTLKPGEYGRDPRDGRWYCCTPNGLRGALGSHDVTEHEDGTITVSPSILVRPANENAPEGSRWREGWHGWLERGAWREC